MSSSSVALSLKQDTCFRVSSFGFRSFFLVGDMIQLYKFKQKHHHRIAYEGNMRLCPMLSLYLSGSLLLPLKGCALYPDWQRATVELWTRPLTLNCSACVQSMYWSPYISHWIRAYDKQKLQII